MLQFTLHHGPDAGLGAGPRPGLRPGRLARARRAAERGRRRRRWPCCSPACTRRSRRSSNARVEVMSALVSFERVFEILDLKPLIEQKPDAGGLPARSALGGVRRRPLRLPLGGQGLPGLAGGRADPGHPRRRGSAARHQLPGGARPDRGPGRLLRRREVHHRAAPVPPVRRRLGRRPLRRQSPARAWTSATSTFDSMRETLGMVTQDGHLFHESIAANLRLARPGGHRGGDVGRAAARPARRPDPVPARRPGHRGGGARLPALRRRAAAPDDRPPAASPSPRVVILDEATARWTPPTRPPSRRRWARRWKAAPPS